MQPREPQGPIQYAPLGLLQFLQLKQSGENPNTLLGSIAPTLDVLPFFMANAMEFEQAATNIPPGGGSNYALLPIVPNGEIWLVHQASVICPCNDTTTRLDQIDMYLSDPRGDFLVTDQRSIASAFPVGIPGLYTFARANVTQDALLLTAGQRLLGFVGGWLIAGGGGGTVTGRMLFRRLQI
jgi:hypothetical protein